VSGYPSGRVPERNAPGQNQPGGPLTPRQRQFKLAAIRLWQAKVKNYIEGLEARMNYKQSNQPRD
jgi:hypothetical protein